MPRRTRLGPGPCRIPGGIRRPGGRACGLFPPGNPGGSGNGGERRAIRCFHRFPSVPVSRRSVKPGHPGSCSAHPAIRMVCPWPRAGRRAAGKDAASSGGMPRFLRHPRAGILELARCLHYHVQSVCCGTGGGKPSLKPVRPGLSEPRPDMVRADVAQSAELLSCKQVVIGSSPIVGSAGRRDAYYMPNRGECPSGQRDLTVNQTAIAFGGSNPPSPIAQAHIAQSVEHLLGKKEVTGSSPVVGSPAPAPTGCGRPARRHANTHMHALTPRRNREDGQGGI